MSNWNSHHFTEEEASDINCLPHTMQLSNPSSGYVATIHNLSHWKLATLMKTGEGSDGEGSDGVTTHLMVGGSE